MIGAGEDAERRRRWRRPSMVMIRLPTMALSRPPEEPGGGVICVNTASDRPPKPCTKASTRIRTSQLRPKIVEA